MDGSVVVPADMRDKARDTDRVPALNSEILLYSSSSK